MKEQGGWKIGKNEGIYFQLFSRKIKTTEADDLTTAENCRKYESTNDGSGKQAERKPIYTYITCLRMRSQNLSHIPHLFLP